MAERPDFWGKITDESVERARRRIGRRMPAVPAWYREAHPDSMRHFAWSFGDDNPLFCEPDYADTTRWGSMIASPFYAANLYEPISDPLTAEERARTAHALAGLHEFHASSEFWFYKPVVPGDRAFAAKWVSAVDVKESSFGGGKSVLRYIDEFCETHRREPIWRHQSMFIHTEREAAKKAGKEKADPTPAYTPADIEEIEAAVMAEKIRGAQPRYFEDVAVGDAIPTITKGPMTITDIIGSHIGRGPGHYAWGPLRLAVKKRLSLAGFYTRNEFGAWDVVQRVHWDQDFARSIGANRIYDYGTQRLNWLGQAVTDWMGDDAFLVRLRCEFRRFNYIGDLSRISGEIASKNEADRTVEITLRCVNQNGVDSTPGNATVALPSRADGNPAVRTAPGDWPDIRR
jgi:acyl dehydratase